MIELLKEKRCLQELQDALTISEEIMCNGIVHISPETAKVCEKALKYYIHQVEN